ncbi:MAG TPA: PQQ-dependent dehydrogenase, methanol/ethanol family [Steroidobacteraceae bacterium]|jgi:alcohol dehydrogenase (cytochrome c)/quinohemoprotein ethanol dehydrogenase
MHGSRPRALSLAVVVALLAACSSNESPPAAAPAAAPKPAAVDAARIEAADREPGNWMTYGRTYDEQRFSPLNQITADNVGQLKLAWHVDLDAAHRAQESTPVIVDGVMYVTTAWSKVFALDAATGKQVWAFDPMAQGPAGFKACCDVPNRGVAVWNGKVYVGTIDGRLIALDAATGKQIWSVVTVDPSKSYTITGAPRVVKGKVIIGSGGSEYITRGYISAYDAETGKQVWRFYTVPGEPGKPDGAASDAVLESTARKTWNAESWKLGGGGTVWDSMAYDPKLDLLYFGTDNGSPWNSAVRSPGGGDNLFIASIIAVRPDTGEYVWHFQEAPGESWDYSAVQHIILADLTIDGRQRQVLLQAPKDGFFYVLDRATGEFLSGKPYGAVNWATGLDPKTGRPSVNPQAHFGETGKPWQALPGPGGAHNWMPMSYNPQTKLVYIPENDLGFVYFGDKHFTPRTFGWDSGIDFDAGSLPEDPKVVAAIKSGLKGNLLAWDPVGQREVWKTPLERPWSGGVVSTAGNLVFEGIATGEFAAFKADDGKRLWSVQTGTGIMAPPVTYQVGADQYVAVELGWGGAFALSAGELARGYVGNDQNVPRLLAFKLNGTDTLPAAPAPSDRKLEPPPDKAAAKVVAQGKAHYHSYCNVCHGDSAVSGGVIPDLRYSNALGSPELWQAIVHDGAKQGNGMISFAPALSAAEIETIRQYVIHRAHAP